MFLYVVCAVCVGFGLAVTSSHVLVQGGGAMTDAHGAMADSKVLPPAPRFATARVEDFFCEPLLLHVEDLVHEAPLAHIEGLVKDPPRRPSGCGCCLRFYAKNAAEWYWSSSLEQLVLFRAILVT